LRVAQFLANLWQGPYGVVCAIAISSADAEPRRGCGLGRGGLDGQGRVPLPSVSGTAQRKGLGEGAPQQRPQPRGARRRRRAGCDPTRVDIGSGASRSGCGNRQAGRLRLAASTGRSIFRDQLRRLRMLGSVPIKPSWLGVRHRRDALCSIRRTMASTRRSQSTENTPPTRLPGTPIGHYTDPLKHRRQDR
jgi:hypothetical protein